MTLLEIKSTILNRLSNGRCSKVSFRPNAESFVLSSKHWCHFSMSVVTNKGKVSKVFASYHEKVALVKLEAWAWWTCWTKPLSGHHISLNPFKCASVFHVAGFCHLFSSLIYKLFTKRLMCRAKVSIQNVYLLSKRLTARGARPPFYWLKHISLFMVLLYAHRCQFPSQNRKWDVPTMCPCVYINNVWGSEECSAGGWCHQGPRGSLGWLRLIGRKRAGQWWTSPPFSVRLPLSLSLSFLCPLFVKMGTQDCDHDITWVFTHGGTHTDTTSRCWHCVSLREKTSY